MTFYKTWLDTDPDFKKVIMIDWAREGWGQHDRVYPMDVKNWLCNNEVWDWGDYTKIRFQRLDGRQRTRQNVKTWYWNSREVKP